MQYPISHLTIPWSGYDCHNVPTLCKIQSYTHCIRGIISKSIMPCYKTPTPQPYVRGLSQTSDRKLATHLMTDFWTDKQQNNGMFFSILIPLAAGFVQPMRDKVCDFPGSKCEKTYMSPVPNPLPMYLHSLCCLRVCVLFIPVKYFLASTWNQSFAMLQALMPCVVEV